MPQPVGRRRKVRVEAPVSRAAAVPKGLEVSTGGHCFEVPTSPPDSLLSVRASSLSASRPSGLLLSWVCGAAADLTNAIKVAGFAEDAVEQGRILLHAEDVRQRSHFPHDSYIACPTVLMNLISADS